MPGLSKDARAILSGFGQQPGVTPQQLANLEATILSSPVLLKQFNATVAAGNLQAFEPLPPGTHAGGDYRGQTRTMRIPASLLNAAQGRPFRIEETAFVLGHELQHGFNRQATQSANTAFVKELKAEARRPSPDHDYTLPIERMLAQHRRDEAEAQIAGWNALVGQVRMRNPNAGLKEIFKANPGRMMDFIDMSVSLPPTYSIKPNLQLNPDMSISHTPDNIEAMGVNYFDKTAFAFGGPVRLGALGRSDYANYYGASAISAAVQIDTRDARPYQGVQPRMLIDMQRLGLDESLLEENGLVIGRGSPSPKAYYDSSQAPAVLHHFDQTWQTHAYVPIAPADGATGRSPSPDDPSHPDHALLEQIRRGVRGLDDKAGRDYDDASERISRCLLARCREPDASRPLGRVDHVVLGVGGRNVFAVQGRLDDPAHDRVHVVVEQAMRTPVEQSDARLEVASLTAPAASLQHSRQQEQQQAGPSLRM
jgi:hypothetical protein